MKKILLAIFIVLALVGCNKVKDTEDYILIMVDDETGYSYYVATPSGIVYEKATDSVLRPFITATGETININER